MLQISFQKFKSDGYCVEGRQRSSALKIYGDITSEGSKVLIRFCSKSQRKKSFTVSDHTIKAVGLGDFFKNLGKKDLTYQKRWQKT